LRAVTPVISRSSFLALLLLALAVALNAQQGVPTLSGGAGQTPPAQKDPRPPAEETRAATDQADPARGSDASLKITSPLGRTGLVTRLRIVAQIVIPPGTTLSSVDFFVDGARVGTVEKGPPYAVEWVDENPLEQREIVVQANDSAGHLLRDAVTLPPYEVTEKTDVNSVLLETSVYDANGKYVSNLEDSAFAVREDDAPQKIDLISREKVESDLVLLVDNSNSMSRRMEFVRRASDRITAGMREHDRAIVAPFNAHIGTITGPTNDRTTLGQAIGAMRASGGTALLDGLIESTKLLENSEGRRVVVLITDGYDENSTATVDDVLHAVQGTGTTVYVMAIGGVAGISLRGELALRKITDVTGGKVFFPARESEMMAAAEAIATDTHNRYLITYSPANQRKDGAWRSVAVDVPKGMKSRTRAGYFAPEPPPIRPTIEFTITDAARNYVDVTAQDLQVLEDGVPQTVDTFQEAVDPVSIVMALDASGSMKKSEDLVRQTAADFVTAVRPEDSLALITFADKPKFEHVLALNRQWSYDAIKKYSANGGTALYDALYNSLLTLKEVKGRRAIVVLTDGRDEDNPGKAPGSVHVLNDVLKLQQEVGATIYGVGLGQNVDKEIMEKLARESGGQIYYASDASELGASYKRVVENLRRRYVLSYTSTHKDHDGGWRTVEIKPREQDAIVSTLGGYFAPED
jgi:VWFA-related protein